MGFLALLIPILALSIPIVAILAGSPIGKALAERISSKNLPAGGQEDRIRVLEDKIRQLEQLTLSQGSDLRRIEQDYNFISRLLEQKETERT